MFVALSGCDRRVKINAGPCHRMSSGKTGFMVEGLLRGVSLSSYPEELEATEYIR
jgi:hypothetical protein